MSCKKLDCFHKLRNRKNVCLQPNNHSAAHKSFVLFATSFSELHKAGLVLSFETRKMHFCSHPRYLKITTALCSLQQATVSCRKRDSIVSLKSEKMYFCSRSTYLQLTTALCSQPQAAVRCRKLDCVVKSEKNIFAALQATCSSQQPCAVCNHLQEAASSWIAS